MAIGSSVRTASSQFKFVTRRIKTCYSAALDVWSSGSIFNIKVSEEFVLLIFCTSVKSFELQWVVI